MKPYYSEKGITIYHGDCREVLPSLSRAHDVIITDPPYGIGYQHGARKNGAKMGFDGHSIVGDSEPFDPRFLLSSSRLILWGANHYADALPRSAGWIVWDKRCGIPSNDQSDCEIAWTNFLTVARLFSRYWNGGGIAEDRFHVNQKPLSLMKWCINLAGDGKILDPYCGSGTTLRAAKDMNRQAVGIEIAEKYCEIAANRLRQSVMEFP